MTNTPLNPDAVTRSIMGYQLRSSCGVEVAGECKACRSVVEAIITDYLAAAQPVVNNFDPRELNRRGWTCGCKPGDYDECDDCLTTAHELANFLNRPEVKP